MVFFRQDAQHSMNKIIHLTVNAAPDRYTRLYKYERTPFPDNSFPGRNTVPVHLKTLPDCSLTPARCQMETPASGGGIGQ